MPPTLTNFSGLPGPADRIQGQIHCLKFHTLLGPMLMGEGPSGLVGAWFADQRHVPAAAADWPLRRTPLLAEAQAQIEAYLAGELASFDVPLAPYGTPFQQAVWESLRIIPYGQRRTYGDMARAMDKPSSARAVGAAVGRNPWSLIVPCHRVLGSDGRLTGYAGGLQRKQWLLAMEARDGGSQVSGKNSLMTSGS